MTIGVIMFATYVVGLYSRVGSRMGRIRPSNLVIHYSNSSGETHTRKLQLANPRMSSGDRVDPAIEASCEFTQQMLPALAEAADHPDMTEDLAEILSTRAVEVEYHVETGVSVR